MQGAPLVRSENLVMGATCWSQPVPVAGASTVSFAVRSTGNAFGSWSVQYSNDYAPSVDALSSEAKWDTYSPSGFSAPPAASGSGQTFSVVLDGYEFAWARLKFTYTSGSSTATIAVCAK